MRIRKLCGRTGLFYFRVYKERFRGKTLNSLKPGSMNQVNWFSSQTLLLRPKSQNRPDCLQSVFLFYILIQLVLNRDNWSKGLCCESDLYSFIITSELRFNWLEGIPRKVTKWKSDKVIKWIISENWKVKSDSAYSAKSLNWWVLFLTWNQF